eukprot:CAMPEP_0175052322 /NCGR_PEP_ID=MMETSP0052_2-20121109/8295_1 /TAXON_ID=51329 ORGANISM="Polytomella parva, Strain SAG 63-3" /NCGR_SAMPLE_ID=MMETSP0052_2 /ASSEMBLY_ACC=CAM_ASM_000194 /LENGTH=147 /DNA_ID=CAMNT_0016316713 /DNA_START=23 /DNA_END=466 /DNA_ORIENTATION=-
MVSASTTLVCSSAETFFDKDSCINRMLPLARPLNVSYVSKDVTEETFELFSNCLTLENPNSFSDSQAKELQLILQSSFNDKFVAYLGVSPPIRSGANNPLGHSNNWKVDAYCASRNNLEALKEFETRRIPLPPFPDEAGMVFGFPDV